MNENTVATARHGTELVLLQRCLRSDVTYDTVSVHTNDVITDAADSRVVARSLRHSNKPLANACLRLS